MSDSNLIGPRGRTRRSQPLLRALLGDVLRRIRRRQRRTLADVAADARVSMAYLSELERGRKEASSEVLAAVCDALRLELIDVLAEAGRDLVAERSRRVVRIDSIRRAASESSVPPASSRRRDDAHSLLRLAA